ncbi:PepSY-associated TM helix domain-containing protein [Caballeronia cordobensis]|uniref:PepSY-associated TM helix domain-containing protein n=1 Tax=Caballeronia cordobensis TaxID=1353886 RepID=A0A158I9M6_CABCO|nr:PepSY-associated TM helix domain-containing protein [Caballeronia cordobensis]SAL53288.1 PepSY-associated TM helix domain-containing protein [Caballeronia cordobensis]
MSPPASRAKAGLPRLRRYWLTGHRWLALTAGWLLALAGLTGALLMIGVPIDEIVHRDLYEVARSGNAEPMPLDAVRERIDARFGPRAVASFRLPRTPHASLAVNVRGTWDGTVYIDPYSGDELGRIGQNEGFVNFVFNLHSSLAWGSTGKAILACVALCYLFMLMTGIVLWWPRPGMPAFRLELRRGKTLALYDLHRAGGAALGLVIAVSVATGAFMAYRPIGAWISALAGVQPARAPTFAPHERMAMLPLDVLVARARERFPDAQPSLLQMPGKAGQPMRVRLHAPDDPHPNGLTSVSLDPYTGKVLLAQRWNELDPGARAASVIYPLHTGEIGGVPLKTLFGVGGCALFGLCVTGVWQWLRRRKRRNAAA